MSETEPESVVTLGYEVNGPVLSAGILIGTVSRRSASPTRRVVRDGPTGRRLLDAAVVLVIARGRADEEVAP